MQWSISDFINLATALGTFCAIATALWLGYRGIWQSREDALKKAGLYAASITVRLSHSRDVVAGCVANCVFKDLTVPVDISNFRALAQVRKALYDEIFRPDMETLLALSALDNNCANRIASAFDSIELLRRHADSLPDRLFISSGKETEALRQKTLDHWCGTLMAASDLLEVAVRECVKASELAAPTPSGAERYGEPDPGDDN
jgi:hypothetical protein